MTYGIQRYLYRMSKRRSRRNLNSWIAEAVAKYGVGKGCNVLNVGAGGEIGSLLLNLGIEPVSIDIDPTRAPDHLVSVEDLGIFDEGEFDIIFCLEVLEHVEHPDVAMSELYRVLERGGLLIGSTPFLLGIHDAPNDYYRFTRYGLERLADGFGVVAIRERNTYFAAISTLLSRRFAVGSRRERRLALWFSPAILVLMFGLDLLDKVFPVYDGTTGYFFVFRKSG